MMVAPTSGGNASLAANTSEEMDLLPKQILTFQEVAPAQEQTIPGESELAEEIKTTAIEGRGHNIIDFLERVYKIADGTIPEGGAPGDILNSLSTVGTFSFYFYRRTQMYNKGKNPSTLRLSSTQ